MPDFVNKEDLLSGKIDVIEVPWAPKGHVYLVPRPTLLDYDAKAFRFYESPWDDRLSSYARYSHTFRNALCFHDGRHQDHTLAEHVESERDKALDFLARLLDDWCTEMGADPEVVWRRPRIFERDLRERRRAMVFTGYYGVTVNNPADFAKIVVT
jgi:hypothetical protein